LHLAINKTVPEIINTNQMSYEFAVQQIFGNAKHKACIRKEVGIHSLRHSFTTHLLNKRTGIKYIKELQGILI
jgi:site-specific recombinase XerD